jgi:hypothetical protein
MILALMLFFQMNCDLMHHGDAVMGFSHQATTHAFKLSDDGGAIEATAKDPSDAKSIAAIRSHFRTIAKEFAAGDFAKPKQIHGELPDGAADMAALKASIKYEYVELDGGARVRITTSGGKALDAVHRFLRYQQREHHTESGGGGWGQGAESGGKTAGPLRSALSPAP